MQFIEWIPAPNNWQNLMPHPLADVVNFGVGIDLDGLAAHMKQHGYDENEPIVLYRDKIIDARHRHAAAIIAGVIPTFARFIGQDPIAYVGKKAFRQHLSVSHRAMIAATMNKMEPAESSPTQQEMADAMKVSRRSVQVASKVVEGGTKALNKAVKDGKITINDAAAVASLPPKAQDCAVRDVEAGKAKTVAEAAFPVCERCKEIGADGADCTGCSYLRDLYARGKKLPKTAPDRYEDDAGTVVPQRLVPYFKAVPLYDKAMAQLTACANTFKEIETGPTKIARPLSEKHYRKYFQTFKSAREAVKAMRPSLVCGKCGGEACEVCCDGYLPFERTPNQETP